jgi:CheY-like chemotaxis protein
MGYRPCVLLADGHMGVLVNASNILHGEFDVVGAVTDGRAAVNAACELKPDSVVLDIAMPELDGLDAAKELRRYGFQRKSGVPDRSGRRRVWRGGAG